MPDMSKANDCRLSQLLDKPFRFRGAVTSWRGVVESGVFTRREIWLQEYATRKRNGTYAKLRTPKANYVLLDDSGTGLTCPKMVFDWAESIPRTDSRPKYCD